MSAIARAGIAGALIIVSALIPMITESDVAYVVFGIASVFLWLTIIDSCRDARHQGYVSGLRSHRRTTLAQVIRFPTRRDAS